MTADLANPCATCGVVGTLIENACYDCARMCPCCEGPTDPKGTHTCASLLAAAERR